MKNLPATGAIVGAITGFCCWFFLGFMGLPRFLIHVSGLWIIEPVLRFLGLHGQVNLLLPGLIVCVASFTLYGFMFGVMAVAVSRKA